MRLLHLYRPRVPTSRAQSLQVLHTCHALARRGHHVTLLADRVGLQDADRVGDPAGAATPSAALAALGLDHPPSFELRLAPTRHPSLAGAWFRWERSQWRGDLVYARAKRYVAAFPPSVPVVIEAHEVDSELDEEAGRDPRANLRLEQEVFARAAGVVTNSAGTLERLAARHRLPARQVVIWNATRAGPRPVRAPVRPAVVGWVGSPRDWKGLAPVLASLDRWPAGVRLELLGGSGTPHPRVDLRPAVPYPEIPAQLARYSVLLLPLLPNLYGRFLANPLKLWDYLATGIPIVAPDLPPVREVAGNAFVPYDPGDADSIVLAIRRAIEQGSSPPHLRTWEDRAAEIDAFLTPIVS